jgi:hypothetical protein
VHEIAQHLAHVRHLAQREGEVRSALQRLLEAPQRLLQIVRAREGELLELAVGGLEPRDLGARRVALGREVVDLGERAGEAGDPALAVPERIRAQACPTRTGVGSHDAQVGRDLAPALDAVGERGPELAAIVLVDARQPAVAARVGLAQADESEEALREVRERAERVGLEQHRGRAGRVLRCGRGEVELLAQSGADERARRAAARDHGAPAERPRALRGRGVPDVDQDQRGRARAARAQLGEHVERARVAVRELEHERGDVLALERRAQRGERAERLDLDARRAHVARVADHPHTHGPGA